MNLLWKNGVELRKNEKFLDDGLAHCCFHVWVGTSVLSDHMQGDSVKLCDPKFY